MITINNIFDTISRRYKNLSDNEIKSFNHYFSISHHIKETTDRWDEFDKTLSIIFSLKICDISFLTYMVSLDGKVIDESVSYSLHHDYIDDIFGYALKDYIENNKNDVRNDFSLAYTKFYKSIKEKYKRAFNSNLDELSKKAEEKDIISDLEPVHIYPIIVFNNSNSVSLTLKIGRKKQYAISSIDALLARFRSGIAHKYGKDLEFKHNLSILDEPSRKLISQMINHSDYYGSKFVTINKQLFETLFNAYKDNFIYITRDFDHFSEEDDQYLVRLDSYKIKIEIDKDYVLNIITGKNITFISGKYVINEDDKTIDIINEDEIFAELINEINSSPYPCVEDNVDDFKYNYVLRYPDNFVIANEVASEFVFDTLLIKAFFDFDGKCISLVEEIWLEEKKVTINELSYHLASQYRKYRNIISSLGFENDVLRDPNRIVDFLSSSLETLKQYCEVYLSESILNKSISRFNPPTLRIRYQSSMMEIFMEDSRYSEEELFAIINALRKKKKYILYKDQVIILDNEEAERFIENVDDYHLATKENKSTSNKLPIYYAFKALDNSSGVSLNDQILSVFNEIKHYKDNSFKGGKINGTLRKYQLEGVKWLDVLYRNYLNGILADDMGLGKTLEIIAFLKGEKIEGNVLIIAPKSLVFNWKNEFLKFDEIAKVVSIYGSVNDRKKIISSINSHKSTIYLTSYDSFRRDQSLYKDITFDTVILDEAQYIKNAKAKKTEAVTHIQSNHRFVLTGTPIENSILDLWSIFNFLMPNYLPNEKEFKYKYETDESYVQKIRNYVSPFILRRNKKDVLKDLPDKYELIVSSELTEEQDKVYRAHIQLAKNALENGSKFDVLAIMTRLRQICIHPSLFLDEYKGGSGKLDDLNEIIDDKLEDGHRLLIFSQFVGALEMVKDILINKGIPYFMITGDTKAEERVVLANEFNAGKKYKIGLVSLKAGGTGLNLIGADVVIHLDPWWNVAAQDQATDRAHRIGQERNVEVIKLIAENSIEQRVVELQNIKRDLVNKVIADDDSLITSLSLDDIKFILR